MVSNIISFCHNEHNWQTDRRIEFQQQYRALHTCMHSHNNDYHMWALAFKIWSTAQTECQLSFQQLCGCTVFTQTASINSTVLLNDKH